MFKLKSLKKNILIYYYYYLSLVFLIFEQIFKRCFQFLNVEFPLFVPQWSYTSLQF